MSHPERRSKKESSDQAFFISERLSISREELKKGSVNLRGRLACLNPFEISYLHELLMTVCYQFVHISPSLLTDSKVYTNVTRSSKIKV